MLYECGKRARDFLLGLFIFLSLVCFWGVFNKTIIPLDLVGHEMIIANSAIYHLLSSVRLWNNC